jgi:hypothetical protein
MNRDARKGSALIILFCVIVVVVIAAAAIWYFAQNRSSSVGICCDVPTPYATSSVQTVSATPSSTTTSTSYANYKTGYIQSIAQSSVGYSATIQAADFIQDPTAMDDYRIVDHPDETQSFPIASDASITFEGDDATLFQNAGIVTSTDSLPSITMSFDSFEDALRVHSGDPTGFTHLISVSLYHSLYNFSFANGAITSISEQYTP